MVISGGQQNRRSKIFVETSMNVNPSKTDSPNLDFSNAATAFYLFFPYVKFVIEFIALPCIFMVKLKRCICCSQSSTG